METILRQTELNEFGTMTRTLVFTTDSGVSSSVDIPLTSGSSILYGTATAAHGNEKGVSLIVTKTRSVDGKLDDERSGVSISHVPVEHARALAARLLAAADEADAAATAAYELDRAARIADRAAEKAGA